MDIIKSDYDHIARIVCSTDDLFFNLFDSINSFTGRLYGLTYLKLIEADIRTKSITFMCGTDGAPWSIVNDWESNKYNSNIFAICSKYLEYISELHVVYNSSKYFCCGELFSYISNRDSGNEHTRVGSWRWLYNNQNSLSEIVEEIYSAARGCRVSGLYNGSANDTLPITLGDKVVAAFFTENEEAVTENNDTDTTCD